MIGLVNCNAFYVSCERVFQPRLIALPVGVLSNNDGCVIALSTELKALGIPMGMPAFEIQHLVRQGRIHLLSSNYELYGDMSQRVQAVLEEFSAGVEPYSIDEMFVRFDGFASGQLLEHARQLHQKVRQYTGIPVCVGVAPTRTLALSGVRQLFYNHLENIVYNLCKWTLEYALPFTRLRMLNVWFTCVE